MPSIAAHMVVAKLVSEKLKLKNIDFIKGNLLPDIIDNDDSHHITMGKYYTIPDINFFKGKLNFNSYIDLGYYVHLLTDKYYLDDYLYQNVKNIDVFKDKMIYNDYSSINYQLVRYFDLNVNYLKNNLNNYDVKINQDKLNYNLECLSIKETRATSLLVFDDFAAFLSNISNKISEEIYIYASKFNS